MPDIYSWVIPDRVVLVVSPAICDEAFVKLFDAEMVKLLDATLQPLHIVIDVRDIVSYPSTQTFFNLRYLKHARIGRLITIGMTRNPVLRFMASLIARSLGLQITDLSSLEQVESYLKTLQLTS